MVHTMITISVLIHVLQSYYCQPCVDTNAPTQVQEFPNSEGPALACLSVREKKLGLIFCEHNCIGLLREPES